MSHSPDSTKDEHSEKGQRAGGTLSAMLSGGRSYSGRERNCIFLNTGGDSRGQGRFANVSASSGLDFLDDARALGAIDWDHDGDLDVWVTNRNAPRLRLMRNDTPSDHHFVTFRLVGDGKTTNRDAIGARVTVYVQGADGKQTKLLETLRGGEGFLAQSSNRLHFGLGPNQTIEKVVVRWPTKDSMKRTEEFQVDAVDRHYRLVQGSGQIERIDPKPRDLAVTPREPDVPPADEQARIPLQILLPAPELEYLDFLGRKRQWTLDSGKPVLVMLWSKDCATCRSELTELAERESEIRQAGIDVLALSVNGIVNLSDGFDAERVLRKTGFPFTSGLVSEELVERFQQVHDQLMPLHHRLPVPVSFLIDARGRLSVIYKGRVPIDKLIADRNHSAQDHLQRFANSAPIPGRLIDNKWTNDALQRQAVAIQAMHARNLRAEGKIDKAIQQYLGVIRQRPEYVYGYQAVGRAYLKQGKPNQAMPLFQQALELEPENADIHASLANVHGQNGDLEQALEHCQLAVQYAPEKPEFQYNLGNVQLNRNQLDAARSAFEKALELDEQFADASVGLGTVYFMQGDLATAKQHYLNAVRSNPENAEAYYQLGNVAAQERQLEQAKQYFEKALSIKPDYSEAQSNLRKVLALLNQ